MHPLEKKVAEKKKELELASERLRKVREEIAVLQAQIIAYSEALTYLSSSKRTTNGEDAKRGKAAQLSDIWREIFRDIYGWAKTEFGYGDIFEAAEDLGFQINKPSTRTVVMTLVNSGILSRVKNGRFKLTTDGIKALDLPSTVSPAERAAEDSQESDEDVI